MAADGGRSPELRRDIRYSTNAKNYEKDRLILILPLVLSLAAVAAQKKDASKKSTESANHPSPRHGAVCDQLRESGRRFAQREKVTSCRGGVRPSATGVALARAISVAPSNSAALEFWPR